MTTARYFNESEFRACSPSCSLQDMDQRTMDLLDAARDRAGIPFVLNSAYRSEAYELSRGRSGNGAHTRGRAVDIRCTSSANRMKVVRALLEVGFPRIGIGTKFIHADNDDELSQQVIWLY